jgi:hypothetical protein
MLDSKKRSRAQALLLVAVLAASAVACRASDDALDDPTVTGVGEPVASGDTSTYEIEVWADNWMAVYIDGELIGEDSVSITTERSFNAETFTFEATVPFQVAIEAKDFKQTDSGLEYIGESKQQMGDGGIIAQITDAATGEVIAATDASWLALVVHQAPLNTDCVSDADPDSTCKFLITDTPADWASAAFEDSGWMNAIEWSELDVSPKDGYDEINWDASAQLIWGTDLEVDNTVLPRTPELADEPISAETGLFRGAIALAVNGVPIFNALNNRGDDAFLVGELDEFNGQLGSDGVYHYHGTTTYPYLNGGLRVHQPRRRVLPKLTVSSGVDLSVGGAVRHAGGHAHDRRRQRILPLTRAWRGHSSARIARGEPT